MPRFTGRSCATALVVCLIAALTATGCGGDPAAPADPIAVTISPGATTLNGGASQTFTATVANATNTAVTWTASGGTVTPNGTSASYTAPFVGGSYTLTATSVEDPTKNKAITITVPNVTIAVSPTPVTLGAGAVQIFTATVGSTTNTAVTWTATGGAIVPSGSTASFTAPAGGGTITVRATSVADPARSGTATVTATPVAVVITPPVLSLYRGEPTSFTAAVTGSATTGVTWTSTCGTVVGTGATINYTPPATSGECRVIARSTLDNLTGDTVVVTVRPDWLLSTLDDTDDGSCTFTHCSLREAINAANTNPGADIVRIGLSAAGSIGGSGFRSSNPLMGLSQNNIGNAIASITGAGTITLTSALPVISSNIEIVGAGSSQTIIDANASVGSMRRVFTFTGTLTSSLRALTVRGGVTDQGGAGIMISGGANVTLTDLMITANQVRGNQAGGVLVAGTSSATLNNVVIASNTAVNAGISAGGISIIESSTLVMKFGAVRNNNVADGFAGGVRVFGATATFEDVEIKDNVVAAGIGFSGGMTVGMGSNVTLTRVTLSGNTSTVEGGALRLDGANLTMSASTVSGNSSASASGLSIGNAGTVSITGGTITNNISASRAGGIFAWGSGTVVVNDVDITNNRANAGEGGGVYVQNTATVQITDSDIAGNKAFGANRHGGGIFSGTGSTVVMLRGTLANNESADGWGGGAFFNASTGSFNTVAITGNKTFTANGFGGGIGATTNGTLTVRFGQVANNTSTLAAGGGIMVNSGITTIIEDVDIHHNTSALNGGGMYMSGANSVTMTRVIVRDNSSLLNGGGFGSDGATINASSLTVSGNTAGTGGGGMIAMGASSLTMSNSTVSGNNASGNGGGLLVLGTTVVNLNNSSISGNTANLQGGGMQLGGTGSGSVLNRLTIANNTSSTGGGGMTVATTTTITNSTVSGNTTGGTGGGLFSSSTANTSLKNVTFSGNTGAIGGGIGVTGASSIINVTLAGNIATDFGAGIGANNAGAPILRSVLLSGNLRAGVPQNCGTGGGATITSGGSNLSNDATCTSLVLGSDKNNVASGLSPTLANNGGPTLTHALLTGSLAIDAGFVVDCATTDQRAFTRAGPCDIGAFEFGGTAPAGGLGGRGFFSPLRRE